MTAKPQIVIIRKKSGHGGHHGCAWKVAYADFVTAMMALFIVLWLLNSSKQVQEAVGGYFRDPTGTSKKIGSDMQGAEESFSISKDNMAELKEELQKTMRQVPNFDKLKNHIDMTITSEGLRIELLESATSTFFDSGDATPNKDGQDILEALYKELSALPNQIAVEGHTDSKPYPGGEQLFQLGAFRGLRECGAQDHAAKWDSGRPDHAGPRLCQSASSEAGCASRSVQSARFPDCAVFEQELKIRTIPSTRLPAITKKTRSPRQRKLRKRRRRASKIRIRRGEKMVVSTSFPRGNSMPGFLYCAVR